MGVVVAKSAGFCAGVKRAVNAVQKEVDDGKKVATLGRIIHNPQVIENFEKQGVALIQSVDECEDGYTVVLRAHGVSRAVYDALEARGIPYTDATCPSVARTHKLMLEASKGGQVVLYGITELDHPEVVGTLGHAEGPYYTFASAEELRARLESLGPGDGKISLFAQTTFNRLEWDKCMSLAKEFPLDIAVTDTVCKATTLRQREVAELARSVELMVVVGGRWSSNTNELAETAKKYCRTILVESPEQLERHHFEEGWRVGVTAGASTPQSVVSEIKEAIQTLMR